MNKNNPARDKVLANYGIDIDIYAKFFEKIFCGSTRLKEDILVNRFITQLQKEYIRLKTENKHLKEQMKLKDELLEALKNNSQIEQPPPKYEPNNKDGGDTV